MNSTTLFSLQLFRIVFQYINHIKEGGFIIYQKMLKKHQLLEKQIEILEQQIAVLPEGKLIYTTNGKYDKWYQSDGHAKQYIPKENHMLAQNLALKKLLLLQLETLQREKLAVTSYLRHSNPNPHQKEISYINSLAYQKLVAPYHKLYNEEQEIWMSAPYSQNPVHPENLIHKTVSGNRVRSKSEAMIDTILCKYQIPFRYEALLDLGNVKYYPDFTILHPTTNEIIYWENFGMMDNPAYAQSTSEKLTNYISHGILPSHQLICTYETKEHPLSFDLVEKMVEHYLL